MDGYRAAVCGARSTSSRYPPPRDGLANMSTTTDRHTLLPHTGTTVLAVLCAWGDQMGDFCVNFGTKIWEENGFVAKTEEGNEKRTQLTPVSAPF